MRRQIKKPDAVGVSAFFAILQKNRKIYKIVFAFYSFQLYGSTRNEKGFFMPEPVKYKNTVDLAIEHIGNFIAEKMKVGDVLPSERDLAERLQISRNITREALQHFRTLGIIESKPKIGAIVVRLMPEDVYAGYEPFLAISPHTFQDLAHLRMTLELGCAERAVKNVTDDDIKTLTALCEKIKILASSSDVNALSVLNKTDMEFHTAIMKLSGNTLINSLIPLVVESFEKQLLLNAVNYREFGYQEHFDMVDALKDNDLARLSALIRIHLNNYINNCKNKD